MGGNNFQEEYSHALDGTQAEYSYTTLDKKLRHDVEAYLYSLRGRITSRLIQLKRTMSRDIAIKFQLLLNVSLNKFSFESRQDINIHPWFATAMHIIYSRASINNEVDKALSRILSQFDSFIERGSGWVLRDIVQIKLKILNFKSFSGGCKKHQLPEQLRRKRCCASIASDKEEECFLAAVALGLSPTQRNPSRLTCQMKTIIASLPSQLLKFPVKLKDVKIFERNSDISVNIYGWENNVFPYYITEYRDKKHHVNLLLHDNHFYTIRNMSGLIAGQSKNCRSKVHVCDYCLSYFTSSDRLSNHLDLCKRNGQFIEMPTKDSNMLQFDNLQNIAEAPFVIYCDLEALCCKEEYVHSGKTISKSQHVPISFCAMRVCRRNNDFSTEPFIYTGSDCIEKLYSYLEKEYEDIMSIIENVYVPMSLSTEDLKDIEKSSECYLCHRIFDGVHCVKYRDHCHLSGKFRYTLCNTCNLKHTSSMVNSRVYVIFHGFSNYDSHFLVNKLTRYETEKIQIVPKSSEKYLSFTIGNLVFIDSAQFLMDKLSRLASFLGDKGKDYFHTLNLYINDSTKRELMMRKGVFPYEYLKTKEVLGETCLPPREAFFNKLNEEDITEAEYCFAHEVWDKFQCKTIQDYMEIYLKTDVMLLADIFENFRSNCLEYYDLDPVKYYSLPHFTMDAFLRQSNFTLELLTDVDQYLFFSKGIRGGLSMIAKRYARANNKYMKKYDSSIQSSFIIYLDANNLYGKAMMECLPYGDFEWLTKDDIEELNIYQIPPDGEWGYVLEVTLEYPRDLHDLHSDYPLAPQKMKIKPHQWSPFTKDLGEKLGVNSSSIAEKLITSFHPKEGYVVHYRLLQLYLRLGMKLVHIHRACRFRQGPFMRDYIRFNSIKRSEATNEFDVAFYKLLSNSLFGKTIERPENRTRVKLVNTSALLQKYVSKLTFKDSKIINEDLVGVQMRYPSIRLNKPFYIGMVILELAKLHMYEFHYNTIKRLYGNKAHLLMTDTDSLMYHIYTEDVYKELNSQCSEQLDFSNYDPASRFYSEENKRVPGKFKDETGGIPISEFVGLRSKMYALKLHTGIEKKVAKGVKKGVINKTLNFEQYKASLFNTEQYSNSFRAIQSSAHQVYTVHQSKISLSPFDDKRYLLDSIHSLPYCHYKTLTDEKELNEAETEIASPHSPRSEVCQSYAETEEMSHYNPFRKPYAGKRQYSKNYPAYTQSYVPPQTENTSQHEGNEEYLHSFVFQDPRINRRGSLSVNISSWEGRSFIHMTKGQKKISLNSREYEQLKSHMDRIDERLDECKQFLINKGLDPDCDVDNDENLTIISGAKSTAAAKMHPKMIGSKKKRKIANSSESSKGEEDEED